MIGRSTFLELAQGFGLVTPDPFSSRKLGGVWARDYEMTEANMVEYPRAFLMVSFTACVTGRSFPTVGYRTQL